MFATIIPKAFFSIGLPFIHICFYTVLASEAQVIATEARILEGILREDESCTTSSSSTSCTVALLQFNAGTRRAKRKTRLSRDLQDAIPVSAESTRNKLISLVQVDEEEDSGVERKTYVEVDEENGSGADPKTYMEDPKSSSPLAEHPGAGIDPYEVFDGVASYSDLEEVEFTPALIWAEGYSTTGEFALSDESATPKVAGLESKREPSALWAYPVFIVLVSLTVALLFVKALFRKLAVEEGPRGGKAIVHFQELAATQRSAPATTAAVAGSDGRERSGSGVGMVRSIAKELPPSTAAEVWQKLAKAGGYDCTLAPPWSSGKPLRLRVVVEGVVEPTEQPLISPLIGKPCVLFLSSVSRLTHDGMHPVPVAFHSDSTNFRVSLVDDAALKMEVAGKDVFLFNQVEGRCMDTIRYNEAPDHWQDFVRSAHAGALKVSAADMGVACASSLLAENPRLDFQECSLLIGARITLVGELHRSPDGRLTLQPWCGSSAEEKQNIIGKVLASDDPELLECKRVEAIESPSSGSRGHAAASRPDASAPCLDASHVATQPPSLLTRLVAVMLPSRWKAKKRNDFAAFYYA